MTTTSPGHRTNVRQPVTAGAMLLLAFAMLIVPRSAFAAPDAVEKAEFNGYEMLKFKVDGRAALLVVPKTPAAGKPWIVSECCAPG